VARKTTISCAVPPGTVGITGFVTTDMIAQGLSGFEPERTSIQPVLTMLRRVDDLAEVNAYFTFETMLTSRTLAPWPREIVARDSRATLTFVWVSSAEIPIPTEPPRFLEFAVRPERRVQTSAHG
jgi:predicted ABC-type ATPase